MEQMPKKCPRELFVGEFPPSVAFIHPKKMDMVKPGAWHHHLDFPEAVVSLNVFLVLPLVVLVPSSSTPKTRKVLIIPLTP